MRQPPVPSALSRQKPWMASQPSSSSASQVASSSTPSATTRRPSGTAPLGGRASARYERRMGDREVMVERPVHEPLIAHRPQRRRRARGGGRQRGSVPLARRPTRNHLASCAEGAIPGQLRPSGGRTRRLPVRAQAIPKYRAVRMPSAVSGRQVRLAESPVKKTLAWWPRGSQRDPVSLVADGATVEVTRQLHRCVLDVETGVERADSTRTSASAGKPSRSRLGHKRDRSRSRGHSLSRPRNFQPARKIGVRWLDGLTAAEDAAL